MMRRKKTDYKRIDTKGIYECSVSETNNEKNNRLIPREQYIKIVGEKTGKDKKAIADGYDAMMQKVSSNADKYDDVPTAYLTLSITIDELAKHWSEYSDDVKDRLCKKISTAEHADDFRVYMDALNC